MRFIGIEALDENLARDIAADPSISDWAALTHPHAGAGGNQEFHIVFSRVACRGGIVLVGSGSDGRTHWTDARSAHEVLGRFLRGDMLP